MKESEKIRIVFTAPADAGVAEAVLGDPRVEGCEHEALEGKDLVAAACCCDVLVPRSFQTIDRQLLATASVAGLRVVVQASAGLDNIDQEAAEVLGVEVLAVDPGNAVSVAELTLLSLLALFRAIRSHWERTPQPHWPIRDRLTDHEIRGKRLGLVGLGRTGSQVAVRAAAFGMDVRAVDPYISSERFSRFGVRRADSLAALLADCDALSIHCPLTDETRGMIGAEALAQLPVGAVLINAARGSIVDEAALRAALDGGSISGAALDVYEVEPPQAGSLVSHPRVLATPHLGGHTVESHRARGENLREALLQLIGRLSS